MQGSYFDIPRIFPYIVINAMVPFDFCILGCGKQGGVIGNRLVEKGYNVSGVDINEDNLNHFKGEGYKLSIDDPKVLDILKSSHIVINALPSKFGIIGLSKIIEAGKKRRGHYLRRGGCYSL